MTNYKWIIVYTSTVCPFAKLDTCCVRMCKHILNEGECTEERCPLRRDDVSIDTILMLEKQKIDAHNKRHEEAMEIR